MTIREVLKDGGASLAAAGIETAALDAALLLAEVLGMSRAALTAAFPDPVSGEAAAAFEELIRRRRGGECTAYILGRKEFYGLDFLVNASTLVPRPDTETLVEAALEKIGRQGCCANGNARVLDLCTGSGAVAIALKHEMPALDVWASDISTAALAVARTNAARLLFGDSSSIQFRQGDLFKALSAGQGGDWENPRFSLIVSNPPYVPSGAIAGLSPEAQNEPRLALDGGDDGLDLIKQIIVDAPRFLEEGGVLLLEADPRQMPDIACLLERAGFRDTQTRCDLSGRERVIGGRLPEKSRA